MGWKQRDLNDSGAPGAVTAPCAYVFEARGTQHVDYVGEDGHIWEFLWDNNVWHPIDLTDLSGGPLQPVTSAFNKPTGYVFAAQGTQHVVYVSNEDLNAPDRCGACGHIHELWRDNAGWHWHDLTSDHGFPLAAIVPPCGYVFDAQGGTQHVDYIGRDDNHIHELWWDRDGWHHNDLTNNTGAPLAALASPTGYVFAGTQHVSYIGDDGNIHDLSWNLGRWYHDNLTVWAGAGTIDPTAGSLAGYAFAAQGTLHVDYDGVQELRFESGAWHHDHSITQAAGTPPLSPIGVLCAYVFDADGTRHVDYITDEGHVHEFWWDDNGWHYNDLTRAAAGRPPFASPVPRADQGTPAGYVFAAQGTQHVFYRGIEDNHIHELRWEPHVQPPFLQ